MQTVFLLTLCLSMLCSAVTQKPVPCKSPPYLDGTLLVIFPEGQVVLFEKFYYDADQERIRVIATGAQGSRNLNSDVLLLYKEKIYYNINYQNKTCTKAPLNADFTPLAVPPDAHHLALYVVGSLSAPGQGLLANNWVGSVPKMKANYSMSFTEFGCIPLSTYTIVQDTGHFILSYFNIVVGIADPGVLIPPSFCDSAKLVDEDEADFFTVLSKMRV